MKSSLYWCDQETLRGSACGLHLRRWSAPWLNAQVYYFTLVDCNPQTPLLRFVLDFNKLFLHCYAAAGKILTDTSRRVDRLR